MSNLLRNAAINSSALEEWLCRAAERELQLDELQRLAEREGVDLRQLFDALACRVAEQYVSNAWSYAVCNRTMNALFGLMRQTQQCPDLAFAIFFAFCAGQKSQAQGPRGLSAEELYTRPMMARILPGRWNTAPPG